MGCEDQGFQYVPIQDDEAKVDVIVLKNGTPIKLHSYILIAAEKTASGCEIFGRYRISCRTSVRLRLLAACLDLINRVSGCTLPPLAKTQNIADLDKSYGCMSEKGAR